MPANTMKPGDDQPWNPKAQPLFYVSSTNNNNVSGWAMKDWYGQDTFEEPWNGLSVAANTGVGEVVRDKVKDSK